MSISWFCVRCLKDVDGQRDYFGQELCRECEVKNGSRTPTNEVEDRPSSAGVAGVDTGIEGTAIPDEMQTLLEVSGDLNIT